jgi:hypothetical protein
LKTIKAGAPKTGILKARSDRRLFPVELHFGKLNVTHFGKLNLTHSMHGNVFSMGFYIFG